MGVVIEIAAPGTIVAVTAEANVGRAIPSAVFAGCKITKLEMYTKQNNHIKVNVVGQAK